MKKIPTIFRFILCLSLFECFLINRSSAFIPKINEPSEQELKSTAIQIGKTAIQLVQFGQNEEAIKLLKLAVKLNPKEQSLYFRQASIYMDLNDPQKAKFFINEGLSINKNNERGYFQLGNTEIMLKNYNSALIAFKKSSEIPWRAKVSLVLPTSF